MKKIITFLMIVITVSVYASNGKSDMEIGNKAVLTSIELLDVSGEKISLEDVKKENGLLVLFSCNTCPFVMQWESRYPDIKAWADKNNFGMVVLNSNYQNRDGADSYEAMQNKAK